MMNPLPPLVPSCAWDLLCTLQGWRLNRKRYTPQTEAYYRFFLDSDTWSEERLIDYQNRRLREVVEYCAIHTPYYRKRFSELGLKPEDIKTIQDLPLLPCLDKSVIRKQAGDLISDEYSCRKLDTGQTGGSTGTPTRLYFSPETWPAQYGFFWARWRPGVKRGQKYACFQGQNLIPFHQTKPPYWRTNYASNQRLYSVFHLRQDNLSLYVDNLNRYQPVYIQGYPSALYIVADYMRRKNLRFSHPLQAAFSMSETVQSIHKQTIESVWGCPLWDQYGQGERVASITLRECGNYHYDMDFGIIEFDPVGDEQGFTVAEIIGTGLMNKAWTLLRYRTGDLVLFDPKRPCACGRPGPVIKGIFGRTGDILTLPDGRKVMNITTAVKDIPGLVEFQIVHEEPSLIVLNIVRDEGFTDQSEKAIQKSVSDRVGPSVTLQIRYLERIPRTPGGKYKAIISKV